jgi:proline iminopeptidase
LSSLYPKIEPSDQGFLEVGDRQRVYWETCGNPSGIPALVVHGGPGSGCTSWHRRLFNPAAYRIVLFDQRGAGRSTPHASEPDVDLSTNTTQALVADTERLRQHLDVERWVILGGSWGSTLSLAYAEDHPDAVAAMVLWGVTTGRRSEADWLFRDGLEPLFPEQWEQRRNALPPELRDGDIIEGYSTLLFDPDPAVRHAAALAWCTWESVTPAWPPSDGLDDRYKDPAFALGFARLVTHYVRHDDFLEDGVLLRNVGRLSGIPGVLVNGRFDLQARVGNAWTLARTWPDAKLVVVDGEGHAGNAPGITRELIRATNGFAGRCAPGFG